MDGIKQEKTQNRLTDFWVEIFSMEPPEYKAGAPQTQKLRQTSEKYSNNQNRSRPSATPAA
jgi:hypothetical protein